MPSKPILCIDFDGVINSYTSGWKGADIIPDLPVPGAIEALLGCLEHFTVCIVTSRFNAWNDGPQIDTFGAVRNWLMDNGVPGGLINQYPEDPDGPGMDQERINLCVTKPAAFMTIDDRGWRFDGIFPTVEQIKAFRTWQK